MITSIKIVPIAMRGRPDNAGKYIQQLEPRFDGVISSLTSAQKDTMILEIRRNL